MRVMHYEGDPVAVTDHDGPGAVKVEWHELGEDGAHLVPTGVTCGGWVEGVGAEAVLFVPSDGQDTAYDAWLGEDGLPEAEGGWYVVGTGEGAIHGLPGAPLAVWGYRGLPESGRLVDDPTEEQV